MCESRSILPDLEAPVRGDNVPESPPSLHVALIQCVAEPVEDGLLQEVHPQGPGLQGLGHVRFTRIHHGLGLLHEDSK